MGPKFADPVSTVPIAPAHGFPKWEADESGTIFLDEQRFSGGSLAQPEPEHEFDQRVTW